MGDPLGSPRVAPLFASRSPGCQVFLLLVFFFPLRALRSPKTARGTPCPTPDEWGPRAHRTRRPMENGPGMRPKWLILGDEMGHNGAEPSCPRRGARRELRVHMLLAA
ncbi:UNVERIFIED_CONTAM: hypothetical protein Sindi_1386000 [Sesamum indicum]